MKTINFLKNNSTINSLASNRISSGASSVLQRNPLQSMFENTSSPSSSTLGDVGNTLGDVWDRIKNGNVNVYNKEIAMQNLAFQQQNLDYQKQLQQQLFEREDTAYTRMLSDVRRAGLNPLTTNALQSGEAIPIQSKNNDFNYTDMGNLSAISNILSTILSFKSGLAEIKNLDAQTNKTNAEAVGIANSNSIFDYDVEKGIRKYLFDSGKQDYFSKVLRNLSENRNYEFNRLMGWSENTPDILKAISLGANMKLLGSDSGAFDKLTNEGKFSSIPLDYNKIYDDSKVTSAFVNRFLDTIDSVLSVGKNKETQDKVLSLGKNLLSLLNVDISNLDFDSIDFNSWLPTTIETYSGGKKKKEYSLPPFFKFFLGR